MRGLVRPPAAVALLGFSLALNGCVLLAFAAGGAATYGAVKYFENDAYRDFHADLDDTWEATLRSMRELGYPVSEGVPHGPTEGTVEVADVAVHVGREPGDFTRVRVRAGTFDTEDHRRRAGLLLDTIARYVD